MSRRAEARLAHGHPWVFSNEITTTLADTRAGELVTVADAAGRPFAVGYANPSALITVRLLDAAGAAIDAAWVEERVRAARVYRERVLADPRYGRMIHAESDGLPGVIVDRFDDVLVVQTLTAGAEALRPGLLEALRRLFEPRAIVVANDSAFRALEGLAEERALIEGTLPDPVVCEESELTFAVDVLGGQKTGFFFDQRDNRRRFAELLRGERVLDLFCYTGAWALIAARLGARVVGRDASAPALAMARENARLNGLSDRVLFEEADLLGAAPVPEEEMEAFDAVVVDPPPLAKNRRARAAAWRALSKLCRDAAMRVRPGGLLVVCACSHHLGADDLRDALAAGGAKARRRLRIVAQGAQAADHPILPAAPETAYLHALFVDVG